MTTTPTYSQSTAEVQAVALVGGHQEMGSPTRGQMPAPPPPAPAPAPIPTPPTPPRPPAPPIPSGSTR
jgi:hypothetical protein